MKADENNQNRTKDKCIRVKLKCFLYILLLCVTLFPFGAVQVQAEGERVYFGSENYQWNLGETAQIGVYAGLSGNIVSVDMYVLFDEEMLEHASGGELIAPGRIHVSASGVGSTEFMQMLEFVPEVGGTTSVTIQEVQITDENGNAFSPAAVGVQIQIPEADATAPNQILINGQPIPGFQPGITNYTIDVSAETEQAAITIDPADMQAAISNTSLVEGQNEISIFITNESGWRTRYILTVNRASASETETTSETDSAVQTTGDVGDAGVQTGITDQNPATEQESGTIRHQVIVTAIIVVFLLLLFSLIVICIKLEKKKREKQRRRQASLRAKRNRKHREQQAKIKKEEKKPESPNQDEGITIQETRELEVSVQNVTMEFKREKDEATSIKELLIRTLKHQRSYEMFKALDNVSFDIYKGEVVGIIGTNGSGKSTILKIISGALAPTKGTVQVDRNKIQLLTLGTGFDFELTGRENVYLNGAIIGYTKEYIDERYDDIVKFAELEGFMEEKVRNYSSGMVSRLGFAIATIRDTPEILILDEVLSVGDMFFRKKSETRIREMMHGGSTVLIVSHSTSVIRNNCTKAVWIEKGVLQAIGDPKDVCTAYEKMNEAG